MNRDETSKGELCNTGRASPRSFVRRSRHVFWLALALATYAVSSSGCSSCQSDQPQYQRHFECDGGDCWDDDDPRRDLGVTPGRDATSLDTGETCGGETCAPDAFCMDDRCVAACEGPIDCPDGSRCTNGGYCQPRGIDAGGSTPDDIGPGRDTNSTGDATVAPTPDASPDTTGDTGERDAGPSPECTVHGDCGSDEICRDGRCLSDDICTSDTDCGGHTVCQRGECRLPCRTNGDCRPGERCTDANRCRPDTGSGGGTRCTSSADCQPCEICRSGVCEVAETLCRDDSDCGFAKDCLDGVCHYECTSNGDCPRGQACRQGLCRTKRSPTPECRTSADCASGSCVGGLCYDYCRSDADCGSKQMCDHGVCQPDYRPGPECRDNADCPNATRCVNGYCTVSCRRDAECRSGTCRRGYCVR